jgi:hypothetical protein
MTKSMAAVIPIRRERSRKIDLVLALAMLNKAVEARERALQVKLALFARSAFRPLEGYSDAKSLGA